MLTIPDIAALGIDKAAVLSTAQDVMPGLTTTDPALRARLSAVCAYAQHVEGTLANLIELRLRDIYTGYELINEPRDEVDEAAHDIWDETLGFEIEKELGAVREKIGRDVFDEIAGSDVGYHEVGRLSEIAEALAERITPHLANPPEKDAGKWLSKVGIVKADLVPLVEFAKTAPVAPPSDETDTTPYAGTNGPVVEDEEDDAIPAPGKAALLQAIVLWAEGSGPSFQDFAPRLDVTPQTLRNWSIGKMPRSGIKPAQIEVFIEDCEHCIGKLQQALTVFRAAHRSPPP